MSSADESTQSWPKLIGMLNSHRAPEHRHQHRRQLSLVRKGALPATEHYAYPYVLPYVENEYQRTALLRVAGLMCEFPDIPQAGKDSYLSVGKSFRRASAVRAQKHGSDESFFPDPETPDAIASRLETLPSLDLEGCVRIMRSILQLMRGHGVPVDFFALARTLMNWGDGISPQSVETRLRLIRDYYSSGIKIHDSASESTGATSLDSTKAH